MVVDLAHNEAGLEALLEIMNGVRRPGARLLLGLGAVGDRQDDLIEQLGEIGAHGHRRGRDRPQASATCAAAPPEELDDAAPRRRRTGSASTDVPSYPTEVEGLAALVEQAAARRRRRA